MASVQVLSEFSRPCRRRALAFEEPRDVLAAVCRLVPFTLTVHERALALAGAPIAARSTTR